MIDFTAEKDKREIAPHCRLIMPDGSKWYKFSAEYEADKTMTIEFFAMSNEHAQQLVQAMKAGLVLKGQIYEEIPLKTERGN